MTQILTAACTRYVVQVSDRLLTISKGGKSREFDSIANKTVVYRAKDAIVSIGYSGIAYVGAMPTDEWMAQLLWGGPLPRNPDDARSGICLGGQVSVWDIGYASKRIKEAMAGLPSSPVDEFGLCITIAGWQEQRGGARPIVVEIARHRGSTSLTRAPRRWSTHDNFRVYGIGANVDRGTLKAAIEGFRTERGLIHCTPEQIEAVFAGLIRAASAQNASVGSHLLSVFLMRPDIGISGCRFLPMAPHLVLLSSVSGSRTIPVAHTPWIIGGGTLYSPSSVVGDWEIPLAGWSFLVRGAPPDSGILALNSSIAHPLRPAAARH